MIYNGKNIIIQGGAKCLIKQIYKNWLNRFSQIQTPESFEKNRLKMQEDERILRSNILEEQKTPPKPLIPSRGMTKETEKLLEDLKKVGKVIGRPDMVRENGCYGEESRKDKETSYAEENGELRAAEGKPAELGLVKEKPYIPGEESRTEFYADKEKPQISGGGMCTESGAHKEKPQMSGEGSKTKSDEDKDKPQMTGEESRTELDADKEKPHISEKEQHVQMNLFAEHIVERRLEDF